MKALLCLVAMGAAAAQPPASRVEGRVITIAGEPVRGANLTLTGKIETTSDSDGSFVFEAIAPGRYELHVNKAGFLRYAYGQRSAPDYGASFVLEAGQTLKDIVISLTPQSVITGRVLDQDGDPVAAAQVRGRPATSLPQQPPDLLISAITDDQGYFRLAGLDPGRYFLIAIPPVKSPNERPSRTGNGMVLVPTYYPGVSNQASAKAIELAAGADFRGADIHMRLERVYSIRGKITGSPSAVLFAQNIAADVVSVIGGRLFQSSADGSFELRDLLPGDYRIYASSGNSIQLTGATWYFGRSVPGQSNSGPLKLASLEVTIANSDLEGVVLPLTSGLDIAGTIRADDDLLPTGKPIGLTALHGFALNVSSPSVDKSGSFQFTSVQPSKYLLAIATKPGSYVESARFGGRDVTHEPLDVAQGGGSIEIVLSRIVAEVTATVHDSDGAPMPGMLAALWPRELEATSATRGIRIRIADQKGELHFTDLPPGEYYLAALEGMEQTVAQIPEFLAHFTKEAATITLPEGAHRALDITPVRLDKIAEALSKMQEGSR